jgi:hypothetical protein
VATFRFHGRVDKLEIARGHDGLLRGPPDPVLAIAIYVGDPSTFRLLGRSLHRFHPRGSFPATVAPDTELLPSGAIDVSTSFRYVAVAVALEEDGGVDVQRIYGALEHHRMLSVWAPDRAEPEPFSLVTLPDTAAWTVPAEVDLVIDGVSASSSCASDKFIGAVCWTMQPRAEVPTSAYRASVYRLPFLSADRRNDWTALVAIAH